MKTSTNNHQPPAVGDFINIPRWLVRGVVLRVQPSRVRLGAFDVLLMECPLDNDPRTYRLLSGEFNIESSF